MRGADTFTESLFTTRHLDDFVPLDHPLRVMVNKALVLELAHHFGDGRVGHAEPGGQGRRRDGLVLPFRVGINDLDIVFDARGRDCLFHGIQPTR